MNNIINSLRTSIQNHKIISCILGGLAVLGIGRLGGRIITWIQAFRKSPTNLDKTNSSKRSTTEKTDALGIQGSTLQKPNTDKLTINSTSHSSNSSKIFIYTCSNGTYQTVALESIKQQEDPITTVNLKDGKSSLVQVANGSLYLASTVAKMLTTNPLKRSIDRDSGFIWESKEQFEHLLDYLILVTESEEQQALINIKQDYEKSMPLLKELNQKFSLINLLNKIIQGLEKNVMINSSGPPDGGQLHHLDLYYRVQSALPYNIQKFLFPGHIFSKGDPFCVASVRAACSSQIERLRLLLDVIADVDMSSTNLKEQVENVCKFLHTQYPPFIPPAPTPSPWSPLVRENCDISIIDMDILVEGSGHYDLDLKISYSPAQALYSNDDSKKNFLLNLALYTSEILEIPSFANTHPNLLELRKANLDLVSFAKEIKIWYLERLKKINDVPRSFIRSYLREWRKWRDDRLQKGNACIDSLSILKQIPNRELLISLTNTYENVRLDFDCISKQNTVMQQIEKLIPLEVAKVYINDLFSKNEESGYFDYIDEAFGFENSQILEIQLDQKSKRYQSNQSIDRVRLFQDSTTKNFGILKMN